MKINFITDLIEMVSLNQLCGSYLESKPDMKKPTKDSYKGVVEHLGEIDYKNVELVYQKICENEYWPKPSTRISKLERVSTLLKDNKIDVSEYTKFIIDLKKQNNKQNNQRPISNVNTGNLLNKNIDQFFLKMFIEYNPLRSDLATIKLKKFDVKVDNYFSGQAFVFNTLVKVDGKLKIDLKPEDIEFVKSLDTEYLYNISDKVKNRNDHFCKYLKRISLEILGEEMTVDKFRRRYFTLKVAEIQYCKNPVEMLDKLMMLAKQSNTSLEMIKNNYLGKIEFPKKESKETQTQTETPKLQLEDGNYIVMNGILLKKIEI